jgi:asparaginyl-tRNA synthetase
LVKGSVEGGSTLFKLKYFDDYAFLSQSAQLYLEAMIFSLGPVWSLTPSFRAERSRTVRHLAEFLHLEAEAPWVTFEDLMKIQEKLVLFIIKNTIKERSQEFDFLKRDISTLEQISIPFKKMTYEKAIESLQRKDYHIIDNDVSRMIEFGDDLNIESERIITEDSITPIFITHYPLKIKPFYVKEDPSRAGVGLAVDLLAPYGFGEISSGGIREDNLEKLIRQMHSEGLDSSNYEWYLDLRRYGSIPHGGFGIGIERLIRWILNIADIKDTVPFPRTMSRISP